MRIGVFDTGHGGTLVAERLKRILPEHEYVVADDRTNLPYGSRSDDEIISLTDRAIQPLLKQRCDLIVLACNTATAAAIDTLRQRYATVPFVGFEPMLKPATALSTAGRIAVLATPSTLRSERYEGLKRLWASGHEVVEPDCSDWAWSIEQGILPASFDTVIEAIITSGSDTIVLACTHYLALQDEIRVRSGVRVIEPTSSVARRIKDLTGLRPRPRTARPYRRSS